MSKPQPKIAVIGPSQSGKTCLAVGLYNVRRPNLSVSAPNLNNKEYLEARTKKLRNGGWPDGNLPGTLEDIQLDFHARGASTRISFEDFAGEILTSDETFIPFANEHFRRLDGVVLLVNPGAAAFTSEERFSECLSQYRRILTFLGNSNNGARPRVALAVTAADRLAGDLKDSGVAARFRECREGIEAELTNRGFDAETFEVTITGPLADQEKPKLARGSEITAAEPFLWLVDRITGYPERVKRRKIWAACALGAVAIALLAAGIGRWIRIDREAKELKDWEKALQICNQNTLPDEEKLAAASKALSGLRSKEHWKSPQNEEKAKDLLNQYGGEVDRARCENAIKDGELRELATLLREAETNAHLQGDKTRLEQAYGVAYREFINAVAAQVAKRGGESQITSADKDKIRQKAAEVGLPFEETTALEDFRTRVGELADPQRAKCVTWVAENIRPSTPRTGMNSLLRQYVHARDNGDGQLKRNPFCNEIVRTAVYDQYGRWLEEDVASYPSKVTASLFDGKKEAWNTFEQWLNQFRETCRELAGTNDPDPDQSSWAWQFATRAKEEGRFPENALDAFPQTFAVTRIDCRVDYGGKFPFNHKRTSFEASLRVLDPKTWESRKPIPIFKGGDIGKEDEKKWVTVWTNGFRHKGGLFSMALHLDAMDEQNWVSIAGTLGGSGDKTFPLADVPIAALKLYLRKDRNAEYWEFEQEFALRRKSGADKVRFAVRVYGKLERKTPGSLARDLWNEGKWRRPPQEGMAR